MRTTVLSFCAAVLVLGCDGSDPGEDDAGIVLTDSGPADDAGASACAAPEEGFGTSEGRKFSPFTLQRCDGSDYRFYGEEEGYCDARFTVVSIAAGWCNPCRVEAEQMQERLVEAYADQGVRVVVAIIQNNDFGAPDLAFCDGWVDQYELTNPVLIDPTQETQIYFPGDSLPAALIVDSEGTIRYREYGVSVGLETTRAALDELLSEE
ncbi:MAG TPA: TlpA disulfide reductase family protein [Sandaracinaceae bacterium LLY-WYZ-13_1]|nr:TlpA disulfide reductase family protein [Sandaracinaceae bacterium LLY-WYZ-13_1]